MMMAVAFVLLFPLQDPVDDFLRAEGYVEPAPPVQLVPPRVLKKLEAPHFFPRATRATREFTWWCDAAELKWLARHQQPDGSWDCAPRKCACPKIEPPKRSVRELVRDLSSDDIDARDDAACGLSRSGRDARDAIRTEMQGADDDTRGRCSKILAEINRLDSARRSSSLERTGMALAAFLWRGFTHDSPRYGPVIRKGLQRLLALQQRSGGFDDSDPRGSAVAAFTLSLADAWTQSPLFEDAARVARHWASRLETTDPEALTWKTLVVEVECFVLYPRSEHARLETAGKQFHGRTDDISVSAAWCFGRPRSAPALPGFAELGPLAQFLASHSKRRYPHQAEAWQADAREILGRIPIGEGCEHGAAPASDGASRVVLTALQSMTRCELFPPRNPRWR